MSNKGAQISIIAAIGNGRQWNGGLGKDGKLLWHIPDDLKRFKTLTLRHPVIMGRKTFDSIVKIIGKPLPERTNIVVTKNKGFVNPYLDNVVVAHSLEEAIGWAKELDNQEIFIGGGAQIYEAALPYVGKLYLTLIDDEKEADAFFPPYENQSFKKTFEEEKEWNGVKYHWLDLERK